MEKIPLKIDKKSIVLVPFPYSDQSGKKVRPALIISNSEFNRNEDVIICALTSRIKKRAYSIIITSKETVNKKLIDVSQIRVDTITRIKKDLIIKEIDILNEDTFKKVLQILNSIFY
ncbi:MAG: type II toxin-antitoxin system PemK/MazF family toxin [Nanoarchaeota archaeon]